MSSYKTDYYENDIIIADDNLDNLRILTQMLKDKEKVWSQKS